MAYRRGWRRNGTKYNAQKCVVDGITFDSRKEANRYCELKLLERGKVISGLELQKKFVLIPAQYAPDEIVTLKSGKQKVVKGKLLERECAYYCDFAYILNETGEQIIEDVKSEITKTPEFIIKRKLMLYKYGIVVKEI